eukprot:GSChrysophyteH2.ASY1.ANO1.988.1 assembled CDS
MSEQKLCVGKSLWGVAEAGDPDKWDDMLTRIKAEGYTLVESILIFDVNKDRALFRQLLDKHGLELVVQLHTASNWAAFDYCTSCDLDVHVQSFRSLLLDVLQSCLHPSIVNVHSGHDSWDTETAVQYFQQVLQIEAELLVGVHADVLLVHETHRQRLLHSPYQTRDILSHPSMQALQHQQQHQPRALKLNLDVSHWVCVCEKLFDHRDGRDKWWPPVLALTAQHCYLVHGRYGHAEGPQMVDPRPPPPTTTTTTTTAAAADNNNDNDIDNTTTTSTPPEVQAHDSWWTAIFATQRSKGVRSVVVTEHGPEPYQSYNTPVIYTTTTTSTNTTAEKSEVLWQINNYVRDRVVLCYAQSEEVLYSLL